MFEGPAILLLIGLVALAGFWTGKFQVFLLRAVVSVPLRHWLGVMAEAVLRSAPFFVPFLLGLTWLEASVGATGLATGLAMFAAASLACFGVAHGMERTLQRRDALGPDTWRQARIWGWIAGAVCGLSVVILSIQGAG